MVKYFKKWLIYADTYIPSLSPWQQGEHDKMMRRAYMAGFKRAKSIYHDKPAKSDESGWDNYSID